MKLSRRAFLGGLSATAVAAAMPAVSKPVPATVFTELALPLPAAANTNYDVFLWNDAGMPQLALGPAWGADTRRAPEASAFLTKWRERFTGSIRLMSAERKLARYEHQTRSAYYTPLPQG